MPAAEAGLCANSHAAARCRRQVAEGTQGDLRMALPRGSSPVLSQPPPLGRFGAKECEKVLCAGDMPAQSREEARTKKCPIAAGRGWMGRTAVVGAAAVGRMRPTAASLLGCAPGCEAARGAGRGPVLEALTQ